MRKRPSQIEPVEPGQESVWDYPRPPRVEPYRRSVRIEFNGVTIADTARALRVLETSGAPVYYISPDDVHLEFLVPGAKRTICEWKGEAAYWSVSVGGHVAENAAWSYPQPIADYEAIRDYLAFYAGKMDACYVGDERVVPQPGDFYGGWVTSNVVGPFKGEPGSEAW